MNSGQKVNFCVTVTANDYARVQVAINANKYKKNTYYIK